jgi:hypothetical protein
MSPSSLECLASQKPRFFHNGIAENDLAEVFGHLRADLMVMRSRYMQSTYCHDHSVWQDLHDLEKTLLHAEEKMCDLSRRIVQQSDH